MYLEKAGKRAALIIKRPKYRDFLRPDFEN